MTNQAEITRGRSYYYEFFAFTFFFREHEDGEFAKWQAKREILAQNPLNEASQKAFEELAKFDFEVFKKEQNNVLFDLSYANVPMSASFYDEGRDDGAAKVRVIEILKDSLFVRNIQTCSVSEDYFGLIFYAMSEFLREEADGKSDKNASERMFKDVLNGVLDEFLQMLKEHEKSRFFAALATIMDSFFALERSLLAINAPYRDPSVQTPAQIALNRKPYQSKMATAMQKQNSQEFSLTEQ